MDSWFVSKQFQESHYFTPFGMGGGDKFVTMKSLNISLKQTIMISQYLSDKGYIKEI